MRDNPSAFYLCTSGEAKRRAEEHRATFIRLKTALFRVVESYGCEKALICDTMMLLQGIKFPGTVPSGWTKPDRNGCSRPRRIAANLEVRKHFTPDGGYVVKRHPELDVFWRWLACPTGYSYTQGPGRSGSTHIGSLWEPLQMLWYGEDSPICLVIPDVEREKKDAEKEGRLVTGNTLDWKPPKGLKRILREKWNLMQAEAEAEKE